MNGRLIISLIVVIVVTGLFFAALKLVVWVVSAVGRLLVGGPGRDNPTGPGRRAAADWSGPQGGRVCPNGKCRKVNPPPAKYCAQCGKKLLSASMQSDSVSET